MEKMIRLNSPRKVERSEAEETRVLRGYACVFDAVYDMGGWGERIDRHAFDGLDFSNVLLLRDHNYSRVLGRAGVNLRIEVDDVGLFFECELPDTELARETYELARREICDACSFGFWGEFETDFENRMDTIKRITYLDELTITPIPAYRETVVVTMEERRAELERMEQEQRQDEAARLKREEAERILAEIENM